jgi:hypothetical protein
MAKTLAQVVTDADAWAQKEALLQYVASSLLRSLPDECGPSADGLPSLLQEDGSSVTFTSLNGQQLPITQSTVLEVVALLREAADDCAVEKARLTDMEFEVEEANE